MPFLPIEAHRAPDPAPLDEPPADPFEGTDPHQPPIRTPLNDEPITDPNPSVFVGLGDVRLRSLQHVLH
jgi:hypothetical protein